MTTVLVLTFARNSASGSLLSQFNWVRAFFLCFCNSVNIIVPSNPSSPRWQFTTRFVQLHFSMHFSFSPCVLHSPSAWCFLIRWSYLMNASGANCKAFQWVSSSSFLILASAHSPSSRKLFLDWVMKCHTHKNIIIIKVFGRWYKLDFIASCMWFTYGK